jgi:MFS family permease
MSRGTAKTDESTPLLSEQRAAGATSVAEASTAHLDNAESSDHGEDEQAQQTAKTAEIEAIKEAIPMRMVVISLGSLFSCLFVVAIDGTLLITLLNDISTAFSSSDLVFWLGSSYTLAMCAVAPIYGRLNDIIGRKNAIVCAVAIFLFGTFLCTVAPSMLTLIAARATAGIGGGGITTCVAIVLGDLVPLRRRGLYQALGQVVFSLGNATGGPMGGLLTDTFGWRIAIATQLPVLILSLLLIVFFLRIPDFPLTPKEQERKGIEAKLPMFKVIVQRLDLSGSLLLVLACLTLMLALSYLSAYNLPLSNVWVWGNLLAFAVFTTLFIWVQVNVAKEPLLPMSLLRNRTVASATAMYFFLSTSLAMLFYFPVYFRSVLLQSASQTGIHLLPSTVATTAGAFFSGILLKRTGRYKVLLVFCSALCLVSPIWIATWTDLNRPSPFAQNFAFAPLGFGASAISSILIVSVLAAISRELQAVTMGLMYLSRSLGTIIGVSFFGAQLQYSLGRQLKSRIVGKHADETIDKIRKNANIVASLPPKQREAAIESYSASLQVMHISIAVVLFTCFIIGLFVRESPLDGTGASGPKQTDSESNPTEQAAPRDTT